MKHLIPCTVQILTRNNIEGIGACLDSLASFAEVLVQDGGSTDGTREKAAGYANVRLLDQNAAHLDAEGRIIDFSAVRNDSIAAATYDWIFMVDGDERVDPAMIREVETIVSANVPGVFDVSRRFSIDGTPVVHCAGYPALQIRLYHRSLVEGYVKTVHERLRLKPGVTKKLLRTELIVPMPPASTLQGKYDRYLAMEVKRVGVMPWSEWTRWILLRNLRSSIGLTVRVLWLRLKPVPGKRMPLSHEFAFIRHSLRTIIHTFPPRVRRRKDLG